MLPLKQILVPIDWSKESIQAFEVAASLARENGAQLVVLHVVSLKAVMYGPPSKSYLDHMREELCRMKPSDPKVHVEYRLAEGDPVAAILTATREANCDLIVMGTHGRRGVRRLLAGSVAEEVVRKAPCPVLTLKTKSAANLIGRINARDEMQKPSKQGHISASRSLDSL